MSNEKALQMLALVFFESKAGQYSRYSVTNEGSFAAEWISNHGHRGWIDANGINGKYRADGDSQTVDDLLSHLSISKDEVIIFYDKG